MENQNQTNRELTFGEKAVGLDFNHGEGTTWERVNKAKKLSAELIDLVEEQQKDNEINSNPSWIKSVLRTAAFNTLIAAQMAVVKFITWRD